MRVEVIKLKPTIALIMLERKDDAICSFPIEVITGVEERVETHAVVPSTLNQTCRGSSKSLPLCFLFFTNCLNITSSQT